MASGQDELDMETFQRLSDTYQADVQGPLIRNRLPVATLINEFTNADPTYVTKTVALASTYSHYRPIKGDGQCGWRAVVFGYFEILLSQGLDKVAAERVRLQSFNDTLVGVGYDFTMVELFVDETLGLFDSLQQAVASGNRSDQLLLDIFNDETRSNSIIFHFKLMTSATMKSNPDQYQPYLEQPLFEYCRSNIDAFGQEIEQISLQALTDGVIAPANMNVIVMYLDRSEGNEVTPHHLVANASPDWPTITLLYRPGHYDMIYKATPFQAYHVDVSAEQKYFVAPSGFSSSLSDIGVLSHFNEDQSMMQQYSGGSYSQKFRNMNIPVVRFCRPFFPQVSTVEHQGVSSVDIKSSASSYDSTYMPSNMPLGAYGTATKVPEISSPDDTYRGYNGSWPASSSVIHPPMLAPLHPYSSSAAPSPISPVSPKPPSPKKQELQIRLSQPCYEMGQRHHEIIPLETGPFKNSPFNRGHFANPDFQPLMWKAEDDYS